MTNEQKYKTVEERTNKLSEYCRRHEKCGGCALREFSYKYNFCAFGWLALEAEDEKPEPCPFCGRETMPKHLAGGFCVECDCGYTSPFAETEDAAIAAHNRVCRAVKAANEGEVAK